MGRAAGARVVDEEVAEAAKAGRGRVGAILEEDLINLGPQDLGCPPSLVGLRIVSMSRVASWIRNLSRGTTRRNVPWLPL